MTKKLMIGKVAGQRQVCVEIRTTRKPGEGWRTVDLEPAPAEYASVGFVGEVRHPRARDCECCGQIDGEIRRLLDSGELKLSVPRATVERLLALWERWHLNDLQAGTRAQRKALEGRDKAQPYSYDVACEYLKGQAIYQDRGYTYGSAWLVEVVPDEVLREIEALGEEA